MMVAHQLSLPALDVFIGHFRTRFGLGKAGEKLLYRHLTEQGYAVITTSYGEPGDLRVYRPTTGELAIVEVKTARRGLDNKWRFTLTHRSISHAQSDVVVLLAVTDLNRVIPFVIPTAVVAEQHRVTISSHPETYEGKFSIYRQHLKQIEI